MKVDVNLLAKFCRNDILKEKKYAQKLSEKKKPIYHLAGGNNRYMRLARIV